MYVVGFIAQFSNNLSCRIYFTGICYSRYKKYGDPFKTMTSTNCPIIFYCFERDEGSGACP